MLAIAFLAVAVVDLVLLIWAFRLNKQYPSIALILLTAPLLLLWFDNVVIGLGAYIGEGDLLKALNLPRFLGHYILLPISIVAIPAMARQAGFRWAQPWVVTAAFCVLAAWFIGHDLWLFYNSTFYPSCFADVLRYTTHISEATACGPDAVIGSGQQIPPIPAVFLGVSMLIFGTYLWWKIGFKWLCIGALIALPLFGVPYGATGGIFSNIGEPVICGATVLAAVHITRYRHTWQDKV